MKRFKHYLIELTDKDGYTYYLRNNNKSFHWTNHGKDKTYKNLTSAIKKVDYLRRRVSTNETISLIEVSEVPTNVELPNSFYKISYTKVY